MELGVQISEEIVVNELGKIHKCSVKSTFVCRALEREAVWGLGAWFPLASRGKAPGQRIWGASLP